MAGPLLLSDNIFNLRIYPLNLRTADEEAAGHEILYLADGRRSIYDYWTPTTLNAQRLLTVQGDAARQVSCLFLDRGHNLNGKQVIYEDSPNGSAWTTRVTVTIPAIGAGGTDLTAANGCNTEEGAWGKVWAPFTAALWHRLRIPAMGAGIKPVVVGAWLGLAYQPDFFFMPWSEDQFDFQVPEMVTDWGWRGRGPAVHQRVGGFEARLNAVADYATARPTIVQQYGAGRPMWICYDQAQADRSFLAICPSGAHLDVGYETNYFPRKLRVPYLEHEPLRAA